MNAHPNDLTGRDLDAAVAHALGWKEVRAYGLRLAKPPGSDEWHYYRQYSKSPLAIPELFAEIAARFPDGMVLLVISRAGLFIAQTVCHGGVIDQATGSTPSEALARLLLMVMVG